MIHGRRFILHTDHQLSKKSFSNVALNPIKAPLASRPSADKLMGRHVDYAGPFL